MNKLKGLFLGDERYPQDVTWTQYPDNVEWTVVRNSKEFIEKYKLVDYDVFSFDHDIQDYTKGIETTGYDVLKWMLEHYIFVDSAEVFVHSQNPVGKKNMESYYQNYVNFMKENG